MGRNVMWVKVIQSQAMIDLKVDQPKYDQEMKLYYLVHDKQVYVARLEKGPYRYYRDRII